MIRLCYAGLGLFKFYENGVRERPNSCNWISVKEVAMTNNISPGVSH